MTPLFYYIDLFCGAGGTTTGVEIAHLHGSKIAKVIAAINHDELAIQSHAANHPHTKHYNEDIKSFKVKIFKRLVKQIRKSNPNAKIVLWASLECTNFSKAKGGKARNPDSRTLAWFLPRYIKAIKPDYIQIENVREFKDWGPLDYEMRPIRDKKGIYFEKWRNYIKNEFGYFDEWRQMNAADYGAYTSRDRLFGIFALPNLPIVFPKATYSKKITPIVFDNIKKWKPVREVLDLQDEGQSIFGRKIKLSEKTLERIYAGMVKFIANGDDAFIQNYYSSDNPFSQVSSITKPSPTITTIPHQSVVFVSKYYSGNDSHRCKSVDVPCDTVTTANRHALVRANFITQIFGANSQSANLVDTEAPYRTITTSDGGLLVQPFMIKYHGKSTPLTVDGPASTLTTKDRLGLINTKQFIQTFYSSGTNFRDVNKPVGAILTKPKEALVTASTQQFLMNPQYNNKGASIENPCFTLIAQMGKMPPYLVSTECGNLAIKIFEDDSEATIKIKLFMAYHSIVDVKMRMLKVPELLRIQGFPNNYVLKGSQEKQKKYIGNAVHPLVAKAWVESLANTLINTQLL